MSESILEGHVFPFRKVERFDDSMFTLAEYNCGPHRAKSIGMYLYSKNIERMEWLAQSPGLNPIENLRSISKSKTFTIAMRNTVQYSRLSSNTLEIEIFRGNASTAHRSQELMRNGRNSPMYLYFKDRVGKDRAF